MKFVKSLYINNLLFFLLSGVIVLFVCSFFFQWLHFYAQLALISVLALFVVDLILLYGMRNGIDARRQTLDKLSNGDNNEISIEIENAYQFPVSLEVIDEIPFQFQVRDISFNLFIKSGKRKVLKYYLRPTERGEYSFGVINIYAGSSLRLIKRRYQFDNEQMVPVYPSFMQMRKYELMAISNRLSEVGVKKIRKIGHHTEFEKIKDYVQGDDIRTINWKATARRNKLMVNQYQDERSQQVFSVIDMGRSMRMPFEGLTLLDYAINASLVISNIAIQKHDKAGLVTFNHKMRTILPADRKGAQMNRVMEMLYKQKTSFAESNFEALYSTLKYRVNQRSLILLYTNFETLENLKRQVKYLQRIAKDHLLVVIFFQNTELNELIQKPVDNLEEIYKQTIAEKFAYEKKLIVKELGKFGIHSVLTEPENLTVNSINKYLEIKARNLL